MEQTVRTWQSKSERRAREPPSQDKNSISHNAYQLDTVSYFLSLIDLEVFHTLQFSIHGGFCDGVGKRSPWGHSLLLGRGSTFVVRRVPFDTLKHRVSALGDTWQPQTSKFAVEKQPLLHAASTEFDPERLRAVLLELKVLFHKPIREHPNIVTVHQIRWDSQDGPDLIAPTLVMEYADLGPLSAFQDPSRVVLSARTKKKICLDIAKGLSHLHACGIVHGDVKSENVLLFKGEQNDYCAKVSDFGSCLIEVFDDPNAKLRYLVGNTLIERAPEYEQSLDPLGLRRTDIYSYGVTLWRIMLDGVQPNERLPREKEMQNAEDSDSDRRYLTREEFDMLKRDDETLLRLAFKTIECPSNDDSAQEFARNILSKTMRTQPELRSCNFDELIALFGSIGQNSSCCRSEPLKLGDFGISSLFFPTAISNLRSTPPAFRDLVCSELGKALATLPSTDIRKSQSALALAICHIQHFCTDSSLPEAIRLIVEACQLGNFRAQSLIQRFDFDARVQAVSMDNRKAWLANAVLHGSYFARKDLSVIDEVGLSEFVNSIEERRRSCVSEATLRSCGSVAISSWNCLRDIEESLDPVASKMLLQVGTTVLHCAAYLGYLALSQDLVRQGTFVNVTNQKLETPLHFASINGQIEQVDFLLSEGADPNASSIDQATPLHYAVFSKSATIIQKLLAAGSNIHSCSSSHISFQTESHLFHDYCRSLYGSPLHWAIGSQAVEVVEMLLLAGADPHLQDPGIGATPFQLAIQRCSLQALGLLLDHCRLAPAHLPKFDDLLPFCCGKFSSPLSRIVDFDGAFDDFFFAMIESLKACGVAIDDRGLLLQAIEDDNVRLADHYIQSLGIAAGVEVGSYKYKRLGSESAVEISTSLDELLTLALLRCKPAMVDMILKHTGRLASSVAPNGFTYLGWLSNRNSVAEKEIEVILASLISHGADVAAIDRYGNGPLFDSAQHNQLEALRVLLQHPVDLQDARKAFSICLRDPYSQLSPAMVNALLEARPEILQAPFKSVDRISVLIDVKHLDTNFIRTTCEAAELERDDGINEQKLKSIIWTMKEKLPRGKEILHDWLHEKNHFLGYTALHLAAASGNVKATRILLDEGVNVNILSKNPDFTIPMNEIDPGDALLKRVVSEFTPLNIAFWRSWDMQMKTSADAEIMRQISCSGGDGLERGRFERRTAQILALLKERGGNTNWELLGLPALQ